MDIVFKPFAWLLLQLYNLTGSFGVAVILFSLLAKVILLPLSMKGKKSMLKTQRLQPRLLEIQKKYANDRNKQSEMMQKLYTQENINPMGGCLWSLLPFPIFLILYAVLREPLTHLMGLGADQIAQVAQLLNFEMTSDPYVQINMAQLIHENFAMLSSHVQGLVDINFMFFGINLAEIPNWQFWINPSWALVIPVLSGAAAWGQQVIMQKTSGQDTAAMNQGGMGMMMKLMPLMSVWFGFIMPSAMGVYWIANSAFSSLQDWALGRYYGKKFDAEDARREAEALRKKEQEKAARAEAIRRRQENAELQRAAAGRPKGKKKKGQGQKKKPALQENPSGPEEPAPQEEPDAPDGNEPPKEDWKF